VDNPDDPSVDRVRADLARLGDDAASASDVPASVTERVVSALRAEPLPRRRTRWPAVRLSAAMGVAAAVAAVVVGSVMLARSEMTDRTSEQRLAAEPSVPLSDAEILALLNRSPELGTLGDPRRRASCLSGLGYPGSATVLGGQQVEIQGDPAVLLVLPGDTPDTIAALAVRPNCSSADTGLLADTQIRRP
jgi:hypothetical protein